MADSQVSAAIRKLKNNNYNTWSTCMVSYLQGQDLWEVVNGDSTAEPRVDTNGVVHKWRVKKGKAMFTLKTTIEDELLEHIRDLETPKQAWDALASLFSKKNDMRLQLLENELLSITQKNLAIPQYFHKVGSLCREIGDLDPLARIGEARMKRIIVQGLKPEFQSFVAAVQGWPNQPSLAEFENLLASQEASLAKQMSDVSVSGPVKQESEALYASKGKSKWQGKRNSGFRTKGAEDSRANNNNKREQKEWSGDQKQGNWNKKKKTFKCYNCGRRGHIARDCPSKSQEEGNVAEAEPRVEPAWDAEANFTQTVTKSIHALVATTESLSNKIQDWIVDSGCSNHMTGDKSRLKDPRETK
ncbi:uncharacterized protein LOC143552048 [Bidens hawaiensis]|uniref:uncharacterized protein LOC143552048 n=1 Tax=Bidens hawaiensis TaxID=980011 RepID=UPI0040495C56